MKERTREVRKLASTLTMAEQEERRRVSQILHDDLQQLLYGIQLKLTMISSAIPEDLRKRLGKQADEANKWINNAITTTRRLTVELSPPILKSEGLADALVWLQSQMHDLHGLTVEIDAEDAYPIRNEDMRVLLFHIVRELLFNVAKHAQTDRCTVCLRTIGDELLIEVMDNGKGFDTALIEGEGGFGLVSARERLKLFGGHLEASSIPGHGAHIAVRVPLHQVAFEYEEAF